MGLLRVQGAARDAGATREPQRGPEELSWKAPRGTCPARRWRPYAQGRAMKRTGRRARVIADIG